MQKKIALALIIDAASKLLVKKASSAN